MNNKLFFAIVTFIMLQFSYYLYMLNCNSLNYKNILSAFFAIDILLVLLMVKIIMDDEKND